MLRYLWVVILVVTVAPEQVFIYFHTTMRAYRVVTHTH